MGRTTVKYIVALLIILIGFTYSKALDRPAIVFQVCLSNADSLVTIKWNNPSPTCGSFTKHQIYGKEDELSAFILITEIFNPTTQVYTGKLPNTKTWQFYIATLSACNGDTLFSNTLMVDKIEPQEWEMDSVSVDLLTQKTLVGWSKHPDTDNQGYVIYHVSDNNAAIFNGQGNSFLDTIKGEPALQSEKYALASFDSCGNVSPISKGHSTVFLSGKYDTCGRHIDIQWSEYQGLNPKKYEIFTSNDTLLDFILYPRPDSMLLSQRITGLQAGKQYCYYIKFYAENGITSSSNRLCISTPPVTGDSLHIYYATVLEDKRIEVSWMSKLQEGKVLLHRIDSVGHVRMLRSYDLSPINPTFLYIDETANSDLQSYTYFLTHNDKCSNPILSDTSNIARTIFLQVEEDEFGATLSWNPYLQFANPVSIYEVHKHFGTSFTPRSTWNIYDLLNAGQQQSFDVYQQQEYAYKLCYYVRAIEEDGNSFGRVDTSFSNSVCFTRELAIFFPNAFAPNGVNELFIPVGIGINKESPLNLLEIYNRWGQKIYTTQDIMSGWNGYYNNSLCPSGTYIYKAKVEGDQGEIVEFKGTFFLLN